MLRSTRGLGCIAAMAFLTAVSAFAGKPGPPPPPPDPAIVVTGYSARSGTSLFVMNADGSNLQLLLPASNSKNLGGSNHRQPSWSADGGWLVFGSDMPVRPTGHPELAETGPGIYMIHSSGSSLCRIVGLDGRLGANFPHWAPVVQAGWGGPKIVYVDQVHDRPCDEGLCDQSDLFLVDAVCGAAAPVNLTNSPDLSESHATWSPDAARLALSVADNSGAASSVVVACDLNGDALEGCDDLAFPGPGNPSGVDWSRRGEHLVIHNFGTGSDDLWLYSFADASWAQLTTTAFQEAWPTWSPDDLRIAFFRRDDQNLNIYVVDAVPGSAARDLARPGPGTTRYSMPDWRRY